MAKKDVSRRSFIKDMAIGATALTGAAAFASNAFAADGSGSASASASGSGSAAASAGTGDSATSFESTITWDAEYDVVVIGFGGAGANTAIAAADEGAKVLLLEKAPENMAGGNSKACWQLLCYTSDVNQAIKYFQGMRGNYDTPDDDMITAYCTEMANNEDWIKYLGAEAPVENQRAEWGDLEGSDSFIMLTVHDGMGDGAAYKLFKESVESRSDNITVWYSAPAAALIQDPATKIVHGVTVSVDNKTVNVRARNGVVMTCGGFEHSANYQQQYTGRKFWYSLGHSIYNEGDGIKMALDINADLWHMSTLATNNFEVIDPQTESSSWIYDSPFVRGILVSDTGKRFISESGTGAGKHGYMNYGGMWHTPVLPDITYQITDQSILDEGPLYKSWSPDCSVEIDKGYVLKADTIEELAGLMGLSEDATTNLSATIDLYNQYCTDGNDQEFHRDPEKGLEPLTTAPYYAVKLDHTFVNTQGGPRKNTDGQILDTDGNPIPHLYEAGEFGDIWSNLYQASCNLGGGMIFGRISGKNAAAAKDDNLQDSVMDGKENYVPASLEASAGSASAITDQYEAGDGQYLGQSEGKHGPIVVRVSTDGTAISNVEVLQQVENPVIASYALQKIPADIIAANSSAVDVIAGATFTCNGIIGAVDDALSQVK